MFFLPYLLGLIGVGLLEAGLTVTGIGVTALGFLAVPFREAITEWLDRGPAVDVIERSTSGLSDREVNEFFTLHQEYKQIQKEKREEKEKEYKNTGPNTSGRPLNTQ